KKMNIMECVALSTNQYVELAIRLGTEGDFRGEVKKKILAANSVLYEDAQAVQELAEFFREQ
ncbi:MAG TPA: hypothetical protein VG099_13165, partial [Gemmataceae bacterium]|nr:hypothetical protein [Gemmataceae bacterium]